MVIGFDGSRAFTAKKTGTENYSFQLLKALSLIDKRNKYIVYTRPGVDPKLNLPNNFHLKQIQWKRFWTQDGLAIRTFTDHLDILFVSAHTLPIIRKPGLKTIMTIHDLGVEYLPSLHQLKQQLYLKYITKYQFTSANKLVAVSKATKDDLIKKAGIDGKKISVVYEGYDDKLFKPVKNDALVNSLKQYKLKPKSYFLFVGTIQPRKNLKRLIEAFPKANPNDYLVLIGSKGWLFDEIYTLPKRLGIEKRIKFLGFVPDKDLPSLYSGAKALLFPSLFEGFGLPILEAQACGCPVLTSNTSSMPEVAGKGAVYVNPCLDKDIIRGIRDTGDFREKLIKAGFENIKRFSWEKCAKETLNVMEQLIKL